MVFLIYDAKEEGYWDKACETMHEAIYFLENESRLSNFSTTEIHEYQSEGKTVFAYVDNPKWVVQ